MEVIEGVDGTAFMLIMHGREAGLVPGSASVKFAERIIEIFGGNVLWMANGCIDEELRDDSFLIRVFLLEPAEHRKGGASRFVINMPTIRDTF